jgi:hypothetical protein
MREHGSQPRARKDGLLEETVGEELLLYDQNSHTAHCLSPTAACVWRHCDGELGVAGLAELAGASENLVADALHELREKDLLDAEPQLTQSTIPGISRREAIGRVVGIGAAAAAAPLIVSATAATPAMASSGEELTFNEITAEEKEKGSKCTPKMGAEDCCLCEKEVGLGKATQKFCEEECKNVPTRGNYVEFKKEAVCPK